MSARFEQARWAAAFALAALIGHLYQGTLAYTVEMFRNPLEDLSHGWIVPFVSAYMVWRQRSALRLAASGPSWLGLSGVVLALVLCWFGSRGQQERLGQLSFVVMVWALPTALWGRAVGRLLRLPAAYLLFIIPMASYLDFFTIHLRIFASSLSVALLNGFGLLVEQSGTALISRLPGAEFNVDVADPCSGIRSLFAMMALTAAYASFTQRTALQKWALFGCSIPLAVIGNVLRILSICVVASGFGQEVATGFYHDYSGYVVFLAGVTLMVECGRWLGKLDARVARWEWLPAWLRACGCAPAGGRAAVRRNPAAAWAILCLALALPSAVAGLKRLMPPPLFGAVDFVAQSLPEAVPGYSSDVPWYCHGEQCLESASGRELAQKATTGGGDGFACPACGATMYKISLGESTILPKDTVISKRDYCAPDGLRHSVTLVIAGRLRGSIHRPELCLPAQGFVMTQARELSVQVAGGSPKRVRVIDVQRSDGVRFNLVYWFFCRDRESCSHGDRIMSDIWDRSVHNRINRWVMVAVTTSVALDTPEGKCRFEEFLSGLCGPIHRRG